MILIFEMTCLGRSHFTVNALVIKTISLAFPDEPVTLFADPDHGSAVQQAGIVEPASNVSYEGIAKKSLIQLIFHGNLHTIMGW